MAQAQIRNTAGDVVSAVELDERIFGVERNDTLIHQAVLRIQANRRAGTHDTKTRGQVSGTTAKWYRQKGTGRARHGAQTAPQFRKGGVVFGPHPRSYAQSLPKKMRRKALCSVLSDKVKEGRVHVVESFGFAAPRTKDMVAVLQALGVDRKILIVLSAPDENVTRSARNIPGVRTTVAHTLNVLDAIDSDHLIFTQAALRALENILTGVSASEPQGADNVQPLAAVSAEPAELSSAPSESNTVAASYQSSPAGDQPLSTGATDPERYPAADEAPAVDTAADEALATDTAPDLGAGDANDHQAES